MPRYHAARSSAGRRAGLPCCVVAAILAAAACDTPTRPDTKSPRNCILAAEPSLHSPCMAAPLAMSIAVLAEKGCPWRATTRTPWILLTPPAAAEESGPLGFRVTENWDLPRTGSIELRTPFSQNVTHVMVFQAGCFYWASQDVFQFLAAAGSGSFLVLQSSDPLFCGGPTQNACRWQAVSDSSWIQVTNTGVRTGDDTVSFTVQPNTSGAAREGRISIFGTVVTVRQSP